MIQRRCAVQLPLSDHAAAHPRQGGPEHLGWPALDSYNSPLLPKRIQ
jgi:hypothetical protein